MEKVNFRNSKGLNLVGILHKPKEETKSAIIIAHGSMSNKDRDRFVKASRVFSNGGFSVLRYDSGGSGESDIAQITVENYSDDLRSAIKYMKKEGYEKIGLVGESLGGLASIQAYDTSIGSLVLWSSVTAPKISTIYKGNEKTLEKKGFITHEKDGRIFTIPQQYFNERIKVNQKEILSRIKCPVLLIYGTNDKTIPFEDCKNALKYLPKNSKLKVIEGASHTLNEGITKVISLSLNWFNKFL